MGYFCDYCHEQRSMVYCKSDDACLCLSCDCNIHSANTLSKRHSRTLLCEKCSLHPALTRCVDENISLCQSCDWSSHGHGTSSSSSSSSGQTHRRHTINCYVGCPSAAELTSMWSFALDDRTHVGETSSTSCAQEFGQMCITELDSNANAPPISSVPRLDQLGNVTLLASRGGKSFLDDEIYGDIDMDEVDLNFENYEELFGINFNQTEDFFENVGIDTLFEPKSSTAGVFSGQQDAVATQALSHPVRPEYSNVVSADSIRTSKTEPILHFSTIQANSSISYSGYITATCGEYQDCGASIEEPPWLHSSTGTSNTSASRSSAVMRYMEKKKTRKFDKKVRYETRKARADVRKRVKGRFVKAGEAYDYDPLSPS